VDVPGRRSAVAPVLVAAASLLGACGASAGGPVGEQERAQRPRSTAAGAARPGQRAPVVCGPLRARRLGTVSAEGLIELSGLVRSPRQPGILWAHNDSGDTPRLFALRTDGTAIAELAVAGAEAVDWEDVAAGARALWVGDIGDNDERRDAVVVYRVPEPASPVSGSTAPATRLTLRYPDGAHDAETLLVEPRTGELALVTKELGGDGRAYLASPAAVARAAAGETVTLRRGPRISVGIGGATAGDVSADGRTVVVRGYTGLVAWRKAAHEPLAAGCAAGPAPAACRWPSKGRARRWRSRATAARSSPRRRVPARCCAATRRAERDPEPLLGVAR
jgi:hypothetical protein